MIYYIFRHGETIFSKNGLHYGNYFKTAEILPESIPVIEKLALYLKGKLGSYNFTSPFKRAIQTTDIVTKITGTKFTPEERLGEEELTNALETFNQLTARISDFVKDMENKNANIVSVCSHGWPINTLIALLSKGKVAKTDLGNYPKCGQLTIVEDKDIKTLDFN